MWKTNRLWFAVVVVAFAWVSVSLEAQSAPVLSLGAGDITVEARDDGYHLFIRQKSGVSSVLLTEAFELPDHKLATYALRAVGPNPINDSEKRLLNGKFLTQPHRSLMSSTPLAQPALGKAFHIVLPRLVEYGNASFPNSRYGKVDVQAVLATADKPMWFSVRTFAKPYADYTGPYQDNAFELRSFLVQTPQPSKDAYEPGLFDDFSRLGKPYQSTGIDDALARVRKALDRTGDTLDMVLVIDTTKSMIQNLKIVKANLLGPIREEVKKFKTFRIGLVFYRDYMEDYLTQSVPFRSDLERVQLDLNQAYADGGGDIPEAVVEALWAGLNGFPWQAENRVLLLLGDAPQHPAPRGAITEAQMRDRAAEKKIDVEMIMLPQTKP